MISQQNIKQLSQLSNLSKVGSNAAESLQLAKNQIEPQWSSPVIIIRLSQRSQRYAIEYENRRIGIIKPGIDCTYAEAELRYGAFNSTLETPKAALNWLIQNYLKVRNSGIKFEVSEDLSHYTIERDYDLIKIDVTPEDCIAAIQQGNQLDLAYFPDLRSAILYSFDLILNPKVVYYDNFYGEF